MPLDYYTNLIRVMVDVKMIENFIRIAIPDLWEHFNELNLECSFFLVQWFVCIFTNYVHFKVNNRIKLVN